MTRLRLTLGCVHIASRSAHRDGDGPHHCRPAHEQACYLCRTYKLHAPSSIYYDSRARLISCSFVVGVPRPGRFPPEPQDSDERASRAHPLCFWRRVRCGRCRILVRRQEAHSLDHGQRRGHSVCWVRVSHIDIHDRDADGSAEQSSRLRSSSCRVLVTPRS